MSDETPDLRKLLSTNLDEVKEPPLLPAGTYHGIITKHQFGQTKGDKKTPFVEFMVQLTGHGQDVSAEDVAEVDFSRKQMRATYYLTVDALYRVKEFLQKLDIETAGRSLDAVLPETINKEVLVAVTQLPNKREPGKFYNVIDSLGAAA